MRYDALLRLIREERETLLDATDIHPVFIVLLAVAGDVALYGWLIWDTGQRELVPERLRGVVRTPEELRHFGKWLAIVGCVALAVVCVLIALALLSPMQ